MPESRSSLSLDRPLLVAMTVSLLVPLPLVLLVLPATVSGEEPGVGVKKPLAVEDLYAIEQHATAVLSPRGSSAAFARQWIDPQTREERSSLWLTEQDAARSRLREAHEPDARSPIFSPDGRWIVFRSTRSRGGELPPIPATPPESEVATDLWLIAAAGDSPPVPLTAGPRPYGRVFGDPFYGRVAFSPDGTRLAFVADDARDARTPQEAAADVVLARADQGEGYTGYGVASIWVAELEANPLAARQAARSVRRLTGGDAWYGDPQWTPDGQALVVHANRTKDRESVRFSINKNYDLWRLDLAGGEPKQLTFGPGPEVSPRISPDGRRLVCLSSPRKGPHADVYNFAVVSLDSDPPRTTIVFDHHADPAGAQDAPHPYPSFPLPDPCWDDDEHLLYVAHVGVDTRTMRLDVNSRAAGLAQEGSAEAAASRLVGQRATLAKLVPPAASVLDQRLVGRTSVVRWQGRDGLELEGVLTLPPEGIGQAPYKLLVHPHGGPHSRSSVAFNFTVEVFAAQGYAVFQPNFRGSQGYGRQFLDADRGDFGGGDMHDILTGIDRLVADGVADRERQFVYGISYGGYMTTWLVGHTKQFRAAVAQNAVTDLAMMWGLGDLQSWIEWEFGDKPWRIADKLRDHSPISFVDQIATPTLVLHSRDDRRCPLPMGVAFHRSLERAGVPTELVVYPREGHGIRWPKHREDVLRRTLEWFQKH